MDVLSDVLRTISLSHVIYGKKLFAAPWGVRVQRGGGAGFHTLLDGECWLTVHGEPEPIRLVAGDLALIARGGEHIVQSSLDAPYIEIDQLNQRSPLLQIDGGGPRSSILCGRFSFDAHPLLSMLPAVVRVNFHSGRSATLLSTAIEAIDAEMTKSGSGAQAMIDQLSNVLLIAIVRAYFDDMPSAGQNSWVGAMRDPQVRAALVEIHAQPDRAWSVAELAALSGMSRSGFSVRFKALVGDTPIHYLTRWRMHRAALILRTEALTIQEVMVRVGYDSEATFSKAFKRWLGDSPAAYRRRARGFPHAAA